MRPFRFPNIEKVISLNAVSLATIAMHHVRGNAARITATSSRREEVARQAAIPLGLQRAAPGAAPSLHWMPVPPAEVRLLAMTQSQCRVHRQPRFRRECQLYLVAARVIGGNLRSDFHEDFLRRRIPAEPAGSRIPPESRILRAPGFVPLFVPATSPGTNTGISTPDRRPRSAPLRERYSDSAASRAGTGGDASVTAKPPATVVSGGLR